MAGQATARYDIAFRRATIVDGTGAARVTGDVAVDDGRIAAVGDLGAVSAAREIECDGRVLAPGFIDVHTHDDRALLLDGAMTPKITQGVTTVVTGNCGISLAPLRATRPPPPPLDLIGDSGDYCYATFDAYLDRLESTGLPLNAAPLVGHSTLRVATMRDLARPAGDREIAAMQATLRECLEAGAVGFSSGLFYAPARAAPMEEMVALLEVMKGTGAVYATHMRDESDGVAESLAESFETARRAGTALVVSHHKCVGHNNFGRSSETLALFDRASELQEVALDVYPYTAGSTVLMEDYLGRADRILISWSEPCPDAAGRYLDELAETWRCDEAQAMSRLKPAGAIYFMMDEADVRRIMASPHGMIGSDGLPHDRHPHPRLWGAFPRVLGHYVREIELLSLEAAVHKMTGKSAARFGLSDRGVIRPGACADLVLFDAERIADRATFERPAAPAAGIDLVLVNGQPVLDDGRPTGRLAGRVLRRAA